MKIPIKYHMQKGGSSLTDEQKRNYCKIKNFMTGLGYNVAHENIIYGIITENILNINDFQNWFFANESGMTDRLRRYGYDIPNCDEDIHEYELVDHVILDTSTPLVMAIDQDTITNYSTASILQLEGRNIDIFSHYSNDSGSIWKSLREGIFEGKNDGDRGIMQNYEEGLQLFKHFRENEIKLNDITEIMFKEIKKKFPNLTGDLLDTKIAGNNFLAKNFIYSYFLYLIEESLLSQYNFVVTFVRGDGFCAWYSILAVINKIKGFVNVKNINFKNEYEEFLKILPFLLKKIIKSGNEIFQILLEDSQTGVIIFEDLADKQEHLDDFLKKLYKSNELDDTIVKLIATYYKVNVYVLRIRGQITSDPDITMITKFKEVFAITEIKSILNIDADRNILLINTGNHYTPVMPESESRFWTDAEIVDIRSILNKDITYNNL